VTSAETEDVVSENGLDAYGELTVTLVEDQQGVTPLTQETVAHLLGRAKVFLAGEVDLTTLRYYRTEAGVLVDLVVEKKLGKDTEVTAAELVRRIERAIGQAIRRGQERGEIGSRAHPADGGPKSDYVRGDGIQVRIPENTPGRGLRITPNEAAGIAGNNTLSQHYMLADNVSDEQFEQAVAEGRAEGNLSRSNLVKLVKKVTAPPTRRPTVLRKTRRFDSRTVVDNTVRAAADVVTPSLLAEVDFDELEVGDLEYWISSLTDSIRAQTSLKSALKKELTQRV